MHFCPFLTDMSGAPKAGTKSFSNNENMEITIIYTVAVMIPINYIEAHS